MIKRLIKNIRRQPKARRDSIALSIAGTFTAAIFVVWLYHMPARNALFTAKETDSSAPGFSQFFNEFGNQASAIKSSFNQDTEESKLKADEANVSQRNGLFFGTTTPDGVFNASSTATTSEDYSTSTAENTDTPPAESTEPRPRVVRIITTNSSSSASATTEE